MIDWNRQRGREKEQERDRERYRKIERERDIERCMCVYSAARHSFVRIQNGICAFDLEKNAVTKSSGFALLIS